MQEAKREAKRGPIMLHSPSRRRHHASPPAAAEQGSAEWARGHITAGVLPTDSIAAVKQLVRLHMQAGRQVGLPSSSGTGSSTCHVAHFAPPQCMAAGATHPANLRDGLCNGVLLGFAHRCLRERQRPAVRVHADGLQLDLNGLPAAWMLKGHGAASTSGAAPHRRAML